MECRTLRANRLQCQHIVRISLFDMVIKLDKQKLRSFVEFFTFVTPQIKSLAEVKTDKTGENTPNGLSDDAIYKFNYYASLFNRVLSGIR